MSDNLHSTCREIIHQILQGSIRTEQQLNNKKKKISAIYHLNGLPSNVDILSCALPDEYEKVIEILQRKPVRTISGVAVIAVMTSPAPCPHGICLPCPGGPASVYQSPQSYMGHEPATMRAIQYNFDPYRQVIARLTQLQQIGHPVDKTELIIMGGSFSSRSLCYQEWFVKRCIEAMNDYPSTRQSGTITYIKDIQVENETSRIRNVGITFETRPDWAGIEEVDRMLALGGTKVEIGVQSTYDFILKKINRGHTVYHTRYANKVLRDSGFKVGFHMMPGLPGSSSKMDLRMFTRLFNDEGFMPDYLKIYPTLVTEGTGLYEQWKSQEYHAFELNEAVELIADIKSILPPWVRLQRVQRDIPAWQIKAGVTKSNIRQLAQTRLISKGKKCRCIRCREAGHKGLKGIEPENITMNSVSYNACGAQEHFISYEDVEQDILVGFLRLRFPDSPHRSELDNTALVRELHVYGPLVSVGAKPVDRQWQHRGYGEELLEDAQEKAVTAGYTKLAIISGIGVRPYYRHLGFTQDGPYMSRII
jgi:elongator complex protein 3